MAGDPARQRTILAGNFGLTARDDATPRFAHDILVERSRLFRDRAHPEQRLIMIDGLEMVAQRLTRRRSGHVR
jgi:hypothetical protein